MISIRTRGKRSWRVQAWKIMNKRYLDNIVRTCRGFPIVATLARRRIKRGTGIALDLGGFGFYFLLVFIYLFFFLLKINDTNRWRFSRTDFYRNANASTVFPKRELCPLIICRTFVKNNITIILFDYSLSTHANFWHDMIVTMLHALLVSLIFFFCWDFIFK